MSGNTLSETSPRPAVLNDPQSQRACAAPAPPSRTVRVARNTLWNLLGTGIPILLALLAYPMLIQGLGLERFGILSVVWIIFSFASYFELGLSRELARRIAAARIPEDLTTQPPSREKRRYVSRYDLSRDVWTALTAQTVLGVAVGLILHLAGTSFLLHSNSIPDHLHTELAATFTLVGLSAPLVFLSLAFRGILMGLERFDLINIISIPTTSLTYFAPLLALAYSPTLPAAVGVIVLCRGLGLIWSVAVSLSIFPPLRVPTTPSLQTLLKMLGRGGWMTVSGLLIPVLALFDRFVVARYGTLIDVSHYSTAYDGISRLWILSASFLGSMFPVMSAVGLQRPAELNRLCYRATSILVVTTLPITCLLLIFGQDLLTLWLGAEIGIPTARILRWLAIGVFAVIVAQAPTTMMMSVGRPDIPARCHLVEMPISFLATLWAVQAYGPEGAAVVWMCRGILDAIVMFTAASRLARSVASTTGESAATGITDANEITHPLDRPGAMTYPASPKAPVLPLMIVQKRAKWLFPEHAVRSLVISAFLLVAWGLSLFSATHAFPMRLVLGGLLCGLVVMWEWFSLLSLDDRVRVRHLIRPLMNRLHQS